MKALTRAAFALALALCAAVARAEPKVGDVPHDYLGKDFKDAPVHVSDYKGRVLVVTFWATWCGPCRNELTLLEKVQIAGEGRVQVVAVNYKEELKVWWAVKRSMRDFKITVTRDRDEDVSRAYAVKGIPRMFMIDKTGRIAYAHTGYDEKMFGKILAELNELVARP